MAADKKDISRNSLGFVILLVLLGWILDVLSSFMGMKFGLSESSPYFILFPAGWLIMMISLSIFVYKFKSAPLWLRAAALFWIVAFSYFPAARNMGLIMRLVLG